MQTFIPKGHYVLVEVEKVESVTKAGIYLPEQTQEREQLLSTRGTVRAIGPQAWKEFADGQPWAEIGDKVIFAKYGGVVATANGSDAQYRLLNDVDIIAEIREV